MTVPTIKVKTKMHKREVLQAVEQASMEPLEKCAMLVEGEMKDLLSVGGAVGGLRAGDPQVYWSSYLKRYVKASEPGKPPHMQTGHLMNGVQSSPYGKMSWIVGIIQQVFYGKFHEWGKRPFARVALHNTHKRFSNLFRRMRLAQTSAGQSLNSKRRKK